MDIKIVTKSAESIEQEGGDLLSLHIDGIQELYVYDDIEDPENSRLSGSFAQLYTIQALLEKVYQAGFHKEKLYITHEEL